LDKRCQIHLELGPRAVNIEEVDADLYVAIDRATERAGRATERAIAR
jgi:ribosome-associated translation inhibitor RaiA